MRSAKFIKLVDLIEILGILGILALLVAQTSVIGIPVSQLAGIGALYIALMGAMRRRLSRNGRDDQANKNEIRPEQSFTQTTIYKAAKQNAYISAGPQHHDQSDPDVEQTPVERRAAQNRSLDEFASENRRLDEFTSEDRDSNRRNEGESDQRNTVQSVNENGSEKERERDIEMERE